MSEIEIIEKVWIEFVLAGHEVPEFTDFVSGYKLYESEKNGEF